jgi:hypothetical protein
MKSQMQVAAQYHGPPASPVIKCRSGMTDIPESVESKRTCLRIWFCLLAVLSSGGDLPVIPPSKDSLKAIFPPKIEFDSPRIQVSEHEETESGKKYYVLSIFKMGSGSRIYPMQTVWIARSDLTIARQEEYSDDGQLLDDIHYSDETQIDGFLLPLKMHIERPLDGYTLDLEFKTWKINPNSPDRVFDMAPPPRAKIVHLKNGKSENSMMRSPVFQLFENGTSNRS